MSAKLKEILIGLTRGEISEEIALKEMEKATPLELPLPNRCFLKKGFLMMVIGNFIICT